MAKPLILIIPFVLGYIFDLLFGDPEGWPHPVILFGNMIATGERFLNKDSYKFLKGMFMTLVLCTAIFCSVHFTLNLLVGFNIILYYIIASILVYYALANKSLITEGEKVFNRLKLNGLEAGRKQLSHIVGRDTSKLSEQQIKIAVFETMAENLSDGVIAPIFYYLIAGIPGMLTYKMINTLDSMIGYRNPKYEQFGKFAARLDDAANFIPARLTAFLMVFVTISGRGLNFIFKYGHQHKSPNAGYPEAALAGIIDTRFGGPNIYQGLLVNKPFIGINEREIMSSEIRIVSFINQKTTFLMVLVTVALLYWYW